MGRHLPQPDVAGQALLQQFGWAPATLLESPRNVREYEAAGGGYSGAPALIRGGGDIRGQGGEVPGVYVPPMPSLPPGLSPAQLPGFDPYAGYKAPAVRGTPQPVKPYGLPWDKNWELAWEGASQTGGRGPGAQPEPGWAYSPIVKEPWYKQLVEMVTRLYLPMLTMGLGGQVAPVATTVGAGLTAVAPPLSATLGRPLLHFATGAGLHLAKQALPRGPDVPGPRPPPPPPSTLRAGRVAAGGVGTRDPATSRTRLTTALSSLRRTLEGVRTAQARRRPGGA